jgi:hypothetical protein
MAAPAPIPVKITTVTAAAYRGAGDPQNLVVVGDGAVTKQAAITSITTPDATDLATAITLANATKVKVNDIIVKLRAAGVITSP